MEAFLISMLKSPNLYGTVVGLPAAGGLWRAIRAIHGAVQTEDYNDDKKETTDLLNNILQTMATKTDIQGVTLRIDNLYALAKGDDLPSLVAKNSQARQPSDESPH